MSMKSYRPNDVTLVRVESLNQTQIVPMLEYMGVSLKSVSNNKAARAAALAERIKADPIRAQAAYDIIVLNKVPEVAKDVQQTIDGMRAHYVKVIEEALADSRTQATIETWQRIVEEASKGMEQRMEMAAKKALMEAAQQYRPVVIKSGTKTKVVKGVLPQEYERIVQLASQRVPIMLVGPAGSGKTYIAGKVAEACEVKFYSQSCSEGISESVFTGWLLPIKKGGEFDYTHSPFVNAYEKGGVFLLDEMDAADPNLLTFLNQAIANESFFLPQRYKNPIVNKHPDFIVIGAANTFGHGADAQYVGRNALDAATLDRFRAGMVHMDYSAEVESALVDAEVLEWGRAVRNFIYLNKLRRIMSTRCMLNFTKMKVGCSWGRDQWERAFFADWSRDEIEQWKRTPFASGAAAAVAGGVN